ncbi:MAG: hypothetical protein CSA34_01670 [Desulfobulbus propionicus]|nr:MAG: hypothetical protein CSA34_01670 [Desulfobulbus propionicus]
MGGIALHSVRAEKGRNIDTTELADLCLNKGIDGGDRYFLKLVVLVWVGICYRVMADTCPVLSPRAYAFGLSKQTYA